VVARRSSIWALLPKGFPYTIKGIARVLGSCDAPCATSSNQKHPCHSHRLGQSSFLIRPTVDQDIKYTMKWTINVQPLKGFSVVLISFFRISKDSARGRSLCRLRFLGSVLFKSRLVWNKQEQPRLGRVTQTFPRYIGKGKNAFDLLLSTCPSRYSHPKQRRGMMVTSLLNLLRDQCRAVLM